MQITRVHIEGYRRLASFDLELNESVNVIVGDNETGKSSVLEAINLVLTRRFQGRNIDYSIDPYLFNAEMVANYFEKLRSGQNSDPPKILIEAFLSEKNDATLAKLKGSNNTKNMDCPGVKLEIELDSDHVESLKEYARDLSNSIDVHGGRLPTTGLRSGIYPLEQERSTQVCPEHTVAQAGT